MVARAVEEQGGWSALEGTATLALAGHCPPGVDAGPLVLLRIGAMSSGSAGSRMAIRPWRGRPSRQRSCGNSPSATAARHRRGEPSSGLHQHDRWQHRPAAHRASTSCSTRTRAPPFLLVLGEAVRPDGLAVGLDGASSGRMGTDSALAASGSGCSSPERNPRPPPGGWLAVVSGGGPGTPKPSRMTCLTVPGKCAPYQENRVGAFVATVISWSARFLTLGGHGHGRGPAGLVEALPDRDATTGHVGVPACEPNSWSSGVAEWLLGVFFGPWFDRAPSPLAPAMTMLIMDGHPFLPPRGSVGHSRLASADWSRQSGPQCRTS